MHAYIYGWWLYTDVDSSDSCFNDSNPNGSMKKIKIKPVWKWEEKSHVTYDSKHCRDASVSQSCNDVNRHMTTCTFCMCTYL